MTCRLDVFPCTRAGVMRVWVGVIRVGMVMMMVLLTATPSEEHVFSFGSKSGRGAFD
jgi:hypothetical protein